MGVVGTWTGFLLRHRHAPLARQRLRNIFVIVLLQLAFDLVTPRVSMSAHLGGLFTGFLLGLLVPAKPVFAGALRPLTKEPADARVRGPIDAPVLPRIPSMFGVRCSAFGVRSLPPAARNPLPSIA